MALTKLPVRYCCLYDPNATSSQFQGQKNLSRYVLAALSIAYPNELTRAGLSEPSAVPSVSQLIATARKIARFRRDSGPPRGVTVIDMVLSLGTVPEAQYGDHLILIGHDSYALRARRELAATKPGSAWVRRVVAYLAWRHLEDCLAKLCHRRIYVSAVDAAAAGPRSSALVMPIPLSATMRRAAEVPKIGLRGSPKRLLISVPVLNRAQNRFDLAAIRQVRRLAPPDATLTVWGAAAEPLAARLTDLGGLEFVPWAEDYEAFLRRFDLLIYPRIVGSGFHSKLAEALAVGLPCLAVDWIAKALTDAGYCGLLPFSGISDFAPAVVRALATAAPPPTVSDLADPAVALAPLLEAVEFAREPNSHG